MRLTDANLEYLYVDKQDGEFWSDLCNMNEHSDIGGESVSY